MIVLSRTILSSIAAFSLIGATAQITITDADMPAANDTFRISTTIDAWGIDPAITGANFTWDFSFLEPIDQYVDTMHAVSSTPIAYQFFFNNWILYPDHVADYATRGQDVDIAGFFTMEDVFDYFTNSSSSNRQVGIGATILGIPGSFQFSDIDTIYEFPLDYLNTSSSSWEYNIPIPTLGYYRQRGNRINEVDGWGEVTTPFGTFASLRVKTTLNMVDSIYIDAFGFGFEIPRPETIEYKWLASGMGVPVLTLTESFGVLNGIEYQDSLRVVPLSLNEAEPIKANIWPNPANEMVWFQTNNQNLQFEVISLYGKVVMNGKLEGDGLDVSSLANGTYTVRLFNGNTSAIKKLQIIR